MTHADLVRLLAQVPWPIVAGWLLANVIPYLSALATAAPRWTTGAVSMLLALVDGVLSDLATDAAFNWRAALGSAFVAWAIAALHHSKVLSGTTVEAGLHAIGTSRALAAPVADA